MLLGSSLAVMWPGCVEAATANLDTTIHVRGSKDRQGSQLTFADAAWTEFVGHARQSA
ncbi:DUF397 domain-containing protein [Streptomyces sp. NBC_00878]|uniref:DUF397 domain-containing protein n=1 Tax=Streptomyces sp. NBC_00878 TaxID=2975854 RepID=UPI00225651DD|nr:DUF397 domain-containing protein [Streptomyces sp. NBC_00878]MCX4906377.1 DUF397 domain-containing protein [Streptomyces sp. NBC_00878]